MSALTRDVSRGSRRGPQRLPASQPPSAATTVSPAAGPLCAGRRSCLGLALALRSADTFVGHRLEQPRNPDARLHGLSLSPLQSVGSASDENRLRATSVGRKVVVEHPLLSCLLSGSQRASVPGRCHHGHSYVVIARESPPLWLGKSSGACSPQVRS